MHLVSPGGEGFGDRGNQDRLITGLRFHRTERHGARWAGHRNLGEFRLDAFAELKPNFARRGDRATDGWCGLLKLRMGEGGRCSADQSKRSADRDHGRACHYRAPVNMGRVWEKIGLPMVLGKMSSRNRSRL